MKPQYTKELLIVRFSTEVDSRIKIQTFIEYTCNWCVMFISSGGVS